MVERDEIKKIVADTLKEFGGSFVARSVNDEDEIGMASAWKLNAKEQIVDEGESRKRGRTWFDVAMGNVDKLEKILINSLAQQMNTINVADKNLVHCSNVTNKQILMESGVSSDELMVTDQERMIELIVAKVVERLNTSE